MAPETGRGVDIAPGGALAIARPVRDGRAGGFFAYAPGAWALILIALLAAVCALAPLMTPHARDAIDLGAILAPPSADHVLGTDELGRDVFARLIYAGRFSLLVAFLSVATALAIGVLAGLVAGYRGGAADAVVSLAIDVFLSVPVFLVLLLAASAGGGRLWLVPLVIGGTSWMETARIVRSLAMSLRERGFVEASRAAGAGDAAIVTRHLLPQTAPALVVAATVGFAQAMLVESALSFLGFGVQPPVPTWGNMLENASVFLREAPVAALAPGLMIFIACLAFNYVGEGLRRVLAIER